MIEEQLKKHDDYSIELKTGFVTGKDSKTSDYNLNVWMFIPNSLDVNRFTYDKSHFYRDLKSNIRQITPVRCLHCICNGTKSTYTLLQKSLERFESHPGETTQHDFEFHIKMFQSIFKSSLRDTISRYIDGSEKLTPDKTNELIDDIRSILTKYRGLSKHIENRRTGFNMDEYYGFGDEYMSNVMEYQLFRLLRSEDNRAQDTEYNYLRERILDLIESEIEYRRTKGYSVVEANGGQQNHDLVNRLSLLKKYIESHLYLRVDKRKDGVLMEQLLFSLAAGLSMVFATAVTFSFQQRYGSFTMPLFVALVVSYMLKDRIKEMTRYYFAHKMGTRYFDHKTTMFVNEQKAGWAKESMDFVDETKVPDQVLEVRERSSLLVAHNRANSEKVLLYRVRVHLERNKLNQNHEFETEGVNAIVRFNFSEFTRNMDNPEFELYMPDKENGYSIVEGEKLYYLHIVIEKSEQDDYKAAHYRIALNREGIKRIKKTSNV